MSQDTTRYDLLGTRIDGADRRIDELDERLRAMVSDVSNARASEAVHRQRLDTIDDAIKAIGKIDRKVAWMLGAGTAAAALSGVQLLLRWLLGH